MCSPYVLRQECAAGGVELADLPFRYFLARRCLSHEFEPTVLDWFESDAPWKLVVADFYEQHEFSMLAAHLPASISPLVSPESLSDLRRHMETAFGVELTDHVTVLAHKLVPGQRITIHNDFLGGDNETHRLTVQLNRGLSDDDGGLIVLFNSSDPTDIHRVIRPLTGSCLGFEIDGNSNHAVSRVCRGERYTIVYSFYAQRPRSRNPDLAQDGVFSVD